MGAIIYNQDAALGEGIAGAGTALGKALQQRGLQQHQLQMQQQKLQNDLIKAYAFKKVPSGLGFENKDQIKDLMIRFGMSEDQADRESDLYLALPTGGKTSYANMFFDRMQRGTIRQNQPPQNFSDISGEITKRPNDVSTVNEEKQEFQWPEVNKFDGLNIKEKFNLQAQLRNQNTPFYVENNTKLRGFDDEIRRLRQMEKLNDSKKLPSGLENLNINWKTGEIRFPKLANEETQAFVKMVNDFTTKAKDTFGARVTNFELGTFMQRLPSLANTEEGRRLILAQMKEIAALNKLYHDSKKAVYDQYKLGNIDIQDVEIIAQELRKDDEAVILKNYENSLQAQEVYEAKKVVPKGKSVARAPDGKIVYIFTNQLDAASKKGYEAL